MVASGRGIVQSSHIGSIIEEFLVSRDGAVGLKHGLAVLAAAIWAGRLGARSKRSQGVDVTLHISDGMLHVPIEDGTGVPELTVVPTRLRSPLQKHCHFAHTSIRDPAFVPRFLGFLKKVSA